MNLRGVIVEIAQVDAGGLAHQIALALQAADQLAQRPDRLAQVDHLALEGVDRVQRLRRRGGHELLLDFSIRSPMRSSTL